MLSVCKFIVIPENSEAATHFVSSLRPPSWIPEVTAWREIQFAEGGGVVARMCTFVFRHETTRFLIDYRSNLPVDNRFAVLTSIYKPTC